MFIVRPRWKEHTSSKGTVKKISELHHPCHDFLFRTTVTLIIFSPIREYSLASITSSFPRQKYYMDSFVNPVWRVHHRQPSILPSAIMGYFYNLLDQLLAYYFFLLEQFLHKTYQFLNLHII